MESKLPREYAISQTHQEINAHMEQLIPINFVDLTPTITPDFSEEPDITDPIIVEQVRPLQFNIPAYIQNEKLDPASPIIHLRISGDGHNIRRKVKHVMITVALLDDSAKLFEPNYHYTVVLFPGIENYSTLKIAADTLIRELQELTKNQRGDRQTEWIISKKMSILNENPKAYPGHHSPPLFNMIPLDHYVPDKLHIMLQIETLKIRFEFWKICDTDNWCYTFLMGNDKLCVLRKFNLAKLFDPEHAALIRSLWNGFAELYDLLGERETNPHYFRLKAKE
ncbi:uncharacterized protein OCT59_003776 [Rhizophagus irregularis]|uniref:uncharacterized protein n=1 Tax=Rhizophagus irregularis TaxID=588596 RepID=UPI00332B4AF7|nr:hypothetical protein OCT59_003776 [Rhizophagus irregularis]